MERSNALDKDKLNGEPSQKSGQRKSRSPGGSIVGKIKIADDFDELPEGIAKAFRGECD